MNFVKRVHFLDALLLFSEAGLITLSVSWKKFFHIYGVFSFFLVFAYRVVKVGEVHLSL